MSVSVAAEKSTPWPSEFQRRISKAIEWAADNWDFFLLVGLVTIVFQPWNSRILPVTDFGTFLVERNPSDSVLGQFLSLARYYAADGRFCLVIYLDIVLAIKAFGVWAPGWYWMYFAINCGVLLLARNFLLKTGILRSVVLLTLALWATMGPTAEAWIRPTGEPFALIFFLIAAHAALNFSEASDWRRRIVIIAACIFGVILSKEILVVLLPVVWLLSRLTVRDGAWSWAPWSERDAKLLAVASVATVVALSPAAYFAMNAQQDKYSALYGQSTDRWAATLRRLEVVLIPATPRLHRLVNLTADTGWTLLFTLPSLLWIRVVAGGLFKRPAGNIAWPLVIAIVWIGLGLIAYSPWPINDSFYMMPFALGAMFLSAHAIDRVVRGSRTRLRAALLAGGLVLAAASVEGRSVVFHRQLRARIYSSVIDTIIARGVTTDVIGATPEPAPERRSWARTIGGFAAATRGVQFDRTRDMTCEQAKTALGTTPGLVVISTGWGCGKLTETSTEIAAVVPRYEWPWLWERKQIGARMFVAVSHDGQIQ